MGCIYGIRNEVSRKWYIGKCEGDANSRKRAHFSGRGNKPLWSDIGVYGVENFTFHILHDDISNELIDIYEIGVIVKHNSFKNGYNETRGGEKGGGSQNSHIRTEEHRKKLSIANRSPFYHPAKQLFLSLPIELPLPEKRLALHTEYDEKVNRHTVNKWVKSWHIEQIASIEKQIEELTFKLLTLKQQR